MAKQSNRQQQRSTKKKVTGNPERRNFFGNVKLTDKQKELQKLIEENQIVICTGPAGTAKAQPLHSKILTPNGWSTMGKLKVGDTITSTDGTTQQVSGIYSQGEKEVFHIHTKDGSVVYATEDHLWEIKVSGDTYVEHTFQVIDRLEKGERVLIPSNSEIHFDAKHIISKLPAKTLGAIACKGVISKTDITIDAQIPNWVLEDLRDIVLRPFASHHDANRFYGAAKTASLISDLKRINYTKEDRLGILEGAYEVCGESIGKSHNIQCLSNYGANWLSDIARSLGFSVHKVNDTTITIIEDIKQDREISHIERTGKFEECQCIKVSDVNSLYITDDMVVTHNTYVSTYTALNLIDRGEYDKIILTKPAQESGEKLGFLPGDVDEKIAPYMESFITTMEKLIGQVATKAFVDKGQVEARPLAYMRGSTFDKSIMILDEAQNCDIRQLILFITRMGETSKIIICGDIEQYDVPKAHSGLWQLFKIIQKIKNVGTFEFDRQDIVRSKILIDITDSYNTWKNDNNKS